MKIPVGEYRKRRERLMAAMTPNSVGLIWAAEPATRNRDAEYAYRQDSDFYYLSGLSEAESLIVLAPGREQGEAILFCRERDAEFERWNGPLTGPEAAVTEFGFDDAFAFDTVDEIVPGLIEGRSRVYYSMGLHEAQDRLLFDWVNQIRSRSRNGARPPEEFKVLDHLLHDLRLFKSAAEIRVMRRAAEISAEAHIVAMQACRPGMFEYEVEAALVAHCMKSGARFQAYSPIVAGGANACVLHYIDNDQKLKKTDLLLIDAGCELDNYASDITRTFPIRGRFSDAQRALYAVVLAAQYAAIDQARPGKHWNAPHEAAVRAITEGLVKLGLLSGEVDALIAAEAYKPFYMHRTGHWLGMDVHDVGDYRIDDQWRVFEPGMVFTIEPGLYISPDCESVDRRWRGIGIRIEDDVLITQDGHEILTAGVPKEPDEIERLMARAGADNNGSRVSAG